jgi:transposase InsO family protein
MRNDADSSSRAGLWARLRFSIIAGLLASPPKWGDLKKELERLASRIWHCPITCEPVTFEVPTIERWYYRARGADDPVSMLRRKVRCDAGSLRAMSEAVVQDLRKQYADHPGWTYQLHADNLAVSCAEEGLGDPPSYSTVYRFMKANGLIRQRYPRRPATEGVRRAAARLATLEVRSYEVDFVHGLWHLDFHVGSRCIVLRDGSWVKPILLCVLDDRSRVVCHAQWYLDESTDSLVHGLSQAIQKRGLPRALMSDNGAAMKSAEFTQGLERLSILHELTLEYSPYQNAKQEVFWAQVEGRLIPMLEGHRDLTLDLLNEATQAWIEQEYQREVHSETKQAPLERMLAGPDVSRDSPSSDALRRCFRMRLVRRQRRSDGTITVCGRRFEVPSRYRTMERLVVLVARWDLRSIDLIDGQTDELLSVLWPLDKSRNANGERRSLDPLEGALPPTPPASSGIAPLLRKLMADYAATGLPPAYIPKDDADDDDIAEDLPPWDNGPDADLEGDFDAIPF